MKTIDWDSLTFANNYVFQEVLKNKKLCKYTYEQRENQQQKHTA